MPLSFLVINGPNLNLLGTRQPEIYGADTLEDVERLCRDTAKTVGGSADCFQSNHEGEIIDRIQAARGTHDALIANMGGYSHTSVAIRDAISSIEIPLWEVHVSNILSKLDVKSRVAAADYAHRHGLA